MGTSGAPPGSILACVAHARERLMDAGINADEAGLDARLLAQHVLGWTTTTLLARGDESFPRERLPQFEQLVARRERREPNAYITGEREFWGLNFIVTPDVLIPRPETELLIEQTVALHPDASRAIDVLDLCTGSGAVAVAIAGERRHSRVVATDLSLPALSVARANAMRHEVHDRVMFVRCDLGGALRGGFDLVVANPPYVPDSDRTSLQPEVRDFEPGLALFAGADGMSVIARILDDATRLLAPDGRLLIEHGMGQEQAIAQLISSRPPLRMVASLRDLQGIPRVAVIS
jgi:release factor glutamine methyltransferase